MNAAGEGWLVIEDLADTGQTLRLVRRYFPKAHYAALYAKPKGAPLLNTYVLQVAQDVWIQFPWEES